MRKLKPRPTPKPGQGESGCKEAAAWVDPRPFKDGPYKAFDADGVLTQNEKGDLYQSREFSNEGPEAQKGVREGPSAWRGLGGLWALSAFFGCAAAVVVFWGRYERSRGRFTRAAFASLLFACGLTSVAPSRVRTPPGCPDGKILTSKSNALVCSGCRTIAYVRTIKNGATVRCSTPPHRRRAAAAEHPAARCRPQNSRPLC